MSKPRQEANISPLLNAIIGGITGALEISITYPTEYTKTVMQLYPEINKKGGWQTCKETVRTKGFLSIYRGYGALLLFSVPKNYVRFGSYYYIRHNILTEKNRKNNLIGGMMAGAIESTFVVTP